jgi:hypothetical protein
VVLTGILPVNKPLTDKKLEEILTHNFPDYLQAGTNMLKRAAIFFSSAIIMTGTRSDTA